MTLLMILNSEKTNKQPTSAIKKHNIAVNENKPTNSPPWNSPGAKLKNKSLPSDLGRQYLHGGKTCFQKGGFYLDKCGVTLFAANIFYSVNQTPDALDILATKRRRRSEGQLQPAEIRMNHEE
ncbi:hypothetical protein XENORESO_019477 [Xenotaenia resolanae]|uniref:Uncharacterized protein n=1 Tax=Xenotaenia resolanae TaxID=208358 RepID=A0ABV0W6J0_9TELE